jgi:hypothetical protein
MRGPHGQTISMSPTGAQNPQVPSPQVPLHVAGDEQDRGVRQTRHEALPTMDLYVYLRTNL